MTKQDYITQCLKDALSALDVPYSTPRTEGIAVGSELIYPQIAIERIRSVLNADKLFADL